MLAVRLSSSDRQRDLLTTVGSLLVHVAIFTTLAVHAHLAPEKPSTGPLRFRGQTFDVDALGTPIDEEAGPSAKTGEATGAPLTRQEPPSEPERDIQGSEEPPQDAQGDSDPSLRQPKLPSPDHPGAAAPGDPPRRRESPSAVDPFDQAVPGQPSSSASAPPRPSTGAYGQEGESNVTLDLFPAFLKTLPLAAKADDVWQSFSAGSAGTIEIIVSIDDGGRLLPIEAIESPTVPAPAHLKRAVTLNRNFLLHGRFALGADRETGQQRLRLTARVSKRDADRDTPEAEGVRAFGLQGGEPPTGVYFTYFSGQHVEIEMRRVP